MKNRPPIVWGLLKLIENFASKSYEGQYDGQRYLIPIVRG